MVTITNIAIRKTKDGKTFTSLELTGGLEMVQSQETGKFYATVRKCSVPTTFDEQIAKGLIGSSLEGNIVRSEALPYDYTNPDTGEVMTLNYSWTYVPNDQSSVSSKPRFADMQEAL